MAATHRKASGQADAPAVLKVLRLDDIVAAQDTQYDFVDTPEWSGRVRIASLTGTERQALVTSMRADQKKLGDELALVRFAFRVVAASLVDEDGHHVPDQENAVGRLADKNMAPVQRVFDACRKLSGLGQEELDERLEDLKGTPSASSPTD